MTSSFLIPNSHYLILRNLKPSFEHKENIDTFHGISRHLESEGERHRGTHILPVSPFRAMQAWTKAWKIKEG